MVGGASVVILGAGFAGAPEASVVNLVQPQPDVSDDAPAPAPGADGTYVGPVISNIRGDYQLQIVVAGGVVTDVQFLTAGTEAAQSVAVNARALPLLREAILETQDWNVDYISGASFTSPAMTESARGAFEDAGL